MRTEEDGGRTEGEGRDGGRREGRRGRRTDGLSIATTAMCIVSIAGEDAARGKPRRAKANIRFLACKLLFPPPSFASLGDVCVCACAVVVGDVDSGGWVGVGNMCVGRDDM